MTLSIDASLLRRLDRFRVVVHGSFSNHPGSTPVPRASQDSGIEVARFSAYAPGNDLRHVDWNAYARLNELLVRQFRAEREVPLHLVIDTSASMDVPAGDRKLSFAAALAACLGYVSLRRYDPVRVIAAGTDSDPPRCSPAIRHVRRFSELSSFLSSLQASGAGSLDDTISAHLRNSRVVGSAVILSDFLSPPPLYRAALENLIAQGCGVAVIRLLGPRERSPAHLPGYVRLRDAETGRERVLHLTEFHRAAYANALAAHLEELSHWCSTHGIPCAVVDPTAGLEHCLFHDLPSAGVLA